MVLNRLSTVHTVYVFVDILHRAGAVQADGGDDVLEAVGLHGSEHSPHAGRFHLEHTGHVAAAEEGKRLRVVDRNRRQVELDAVPRFDSAQARRITVRVDSPRKSTLSSPIDSRISISYWVTTLAFAVLGRTVQRSVLDQRPIGDDNAGSMCAGMASQSLEVHRCVDQPPNVVGSGIRILQVDRLLKRVADLDLRPGGDQPGDAIDFRQRDIHCPADVADGGARTQRSKGYDLGHIALAVFFDNIVDELVALVVRVVQVNVRHAHATRVQEALEEQVIGQWVQVGDARSVGDKAAGTRSADVPPYIVAAGELAQVPHDQEIRVETHVMDDLDSCSLRAWTSGSVARLPKRASRPTSTRWRR